MSFILDALRKSDAERQRSVTPGLSDVRYATQRARRNIWLPILVAVLAVNALFLAVQWLGRDETPATTTPGLPDVAGPSQPAAALPEPVPPASEIRPLAREAEFGEPLLEQDVEGEFAAPAGPVPAPVVLESAEMPAAGDPSGDPAPAPVAAPPARPSRIVAGDDLPTAEQLMGSGSLNIPVLNLDLHVYSDTPAGRFVIINSRKYKEGAQLSEGPKVESITTDGVILSNQGRRFTLSRK
jgi:general secretion pathway protein B